MNFEDIQRAAAHAGLKPPDIFLDDRRTRAEDFATRVMGCLTHVEIPDRRAAYAALVASAYVADAELVTRS